MTLQKPEVAVAAHLNNEAVKVTLRQEQDRQHQHGGRLERVPLGVISAQGSLMANEVAPRVPHCDVGRDAVARPV